MKILAEFREFAVKGNAMDLAIGAKQTWVMMEHSTKAGEPKIVPRCTYPVTGLACVSRLYTDLAKWAKARGYTHLRVDGKPQHQDAAERADDRLREILVGEAGALEH